MAKRRTWALIALAGGAALVAAYPAQRSTDDDLLAAGAGATAPSRARIPGNLPERDLLQARKADPFAPPYVAPPPAPPPPTAAAPAGLPPNPYRFAGASTVGSETKVWLSIGDRLYEAKAGEMLDDFWRIKSVRRDSVVLLHLPTKVEQRIEPGPDPR